MPKDEDKPANPAPSGKPEMEDLDGAPTSQQAPAPAGDQSAPKSPAPSQNSGAKTPSPQAPAGLTQSPLIYLGAFILIVIATVAGALFLAKSTKGPAAKNVQSLTSSQLSQLNGSTTVVGSNQQTLDIQSNAIFDGQVLVKSDLDVAGSIKTGGSLALNALSVSGQITDNGNLSTAGNISVGGNLTVSKNLTVSGSGNFGSLTTGTISVTNLQFSGDLNIGHHIDTSGGSPSKSNGSALGSGGTASVNGSDTAGTLTMNTGPNPSAGSLISITFVSKFGATPHVVVTPIGSAAAGLQYYVTRSNSGFTLSSANAPPASSTFSFDYIVIQ